MKSVNELAGVDSRRATHVVRRGVPVPDRFAPPGSKLWAAAVAGRGALLPHGQGVV
jgi:hypothetical protein